MILLLLIFLLYMQKEKNKNTVSKGFLYEPTKELNKIDQAQ